jgi:hypothetical protein
MPATAFHQYRGLIPAGVGEQLEQCLPAFVADVSRLTQVKDRPSWRSNSKPCLLQKIKGEQFEPPDKFDREWRAEQQRDVRFQTVLKIVFQEPNDFDGGLFFRAHGVTDCKLAFATDTPEFCFV